MKYPQFPTNSKWVYENFWSGDVTVENLIGEVKEVFTAKSIPEAIEEIKQVVLYTTLLAYKHTGLSFILYGLDSTFVEDIERIKVWEKILSLYGKEVSMSLFSEGNNWRRPHKVKYVLSRLGVDIPLEAAQLIINHFEGHVSELSKFLESEEGIQYYWDGFTRKETTKVVKGGITYRALPLNPYVSGSLEYKAFQKGSVWKIGCVSIDKGKEQETYIMQSKCDEEDRIVLMEVYKRVSRAEVLNHCVELVMVGGEEEVYEFLYQLSRGNISS